MLLQVFTLEYKYESYEEYWDNILSIVTPAVDLNDPVHMKLWRKSKLIKLIILSSDDGICFDIVPYMCQYDPPIITTTSKTTTTSTSPTTSEVCECIKEGDINYGNPTINLLKSSMKGGAVEKQDNAYYLWTGAELGSFARMYLGDYTDPVSIQYNF